MTDYKVPFDREVMRHNMKELWEDTLWETTAEEKLEISRRKYSEAYSDFKNMMGSPKNNGSIKYMHWAIKKALGLRCANVYFNL